MPDPDILVHLPWLEAPAAENNEIHELEPPSFVAGDTVAQARLGRLHGALRGLNMALSPGRLPAYVKRLEVYSAQCES